MDIRQVKTQDGQDDPEGLLDYLTNYISAWKLDFKDDKGIAEYMTVTRNKRLLSPFGVFIKNKPKPLEKCCPVCGGFDCDITTDYFLIEEFKIKLEQKRLQKYPPSPPREDFFEIVSHEEFIRSITINLSEVSKAFTTF